MTFDIKQNIRIQYFNPTIGEWVNIECETFEVEIDRGIDIEQNVFARPMVGTATVRMMKKSLSDMLSPTGPDYKSNNLLRIQNEYIPGGWLNLFSGVIQNFEMEYNQDAKKLAVTITANDFMKIGLGTRIGTFNITGTATRSYINVMNQLGTAINAIDSRFTLARGGTVGSSTFQYANTYLETSSGELFEQFLDAELGWLWSDRDNQAKYFTRGDVTALQSTAWSSSALIVSNVHSTSSKHVCMDFINLTFKSDEIANQVRVTNPVTGTRTVSTNATSVTNFGRQLQDFTVNFDPGPGTTYANWASEVSGAATPRRLAGVSVPVVQDSGLVSEIVTRDIGEILQVEFASPGLTTLQEVSIISRLQHYITSDHWELNIGLWRGV